MIIDARHLTRDTIIDADICVIGGGPAGITFARNFLNTSTRVVVLESGGLEFDSATQALYDGPTDGVPYFPLISTRSRFFGGTTNHWGGNCHPFSAETFSARDWIKYDGWPITHDEMTPYYDRAADMLKLPDTNRWDPEYWANRGAGTIPGLGEERLHKTVVHVVRGRDRRFNQLFRSEFETSDNIQVYLWSNLMNLATSADADQVTQADIKCLSGNTFSVRSRYFVLAAGGIENARLMLASNEVAPEGLGNSHDLVGRYFMDQPRFTTGTVTPGPNFNDAKLHALTGMGRRDSRVWQIQQNVTPAVQQQHEISQAATYTYAFADPDYEATNRSLATKSIQKLWEDAKKGEFSQEYFTGHLNNVWQDFHQVPKWMYYSLRWPGPDFPVRSIHCGVRLEPVPNPSSRVTLTDDVDALGLRRAKLHWALDQQDIHTIRMATRVYAEELGRLGLGRVNSIMETDDFEWPSAIEGGHHQNGTTRMSSSPTTGVVDPNCKVHGMHNLFVAGSSVFPTAGRGWPTMTLMALSFRLADHLAQQLNRV